MSYDTSLSIFANDGSISQVSYAYEAAKKGGLSVGLVGKDFVLLAAERKSVPKLQDSRTIKKINLVDEHIFMSFSGLISDSRFLIDIARLESQSYRFSLDSTPSLDYIVRQVAFKMQDYTQKPGVRPFGLCCLLGGFNKNNEPSLFSTEPSGFFSQWRSTAIGKNADKVKEYLIENYKDNLEYEEGLYILIESMLEYVESGSKNIEVAIMRKGEVMEGVKDEEVDRISKLIEEKKKEKGNKN
jgi:20S proteasome alpha/beta subunit